MARRVTLTYTVDVDDGDDDDCIEDAEEQLCEALNELPEDLGRFGIERSVDIQPPGKGRGRG